MRDLASYAALVSALSAGAMLFFSFVVTPVVFAELPADTAGRFVRALFRVYYPVLAGATALAALLAWDRAEAFALWAVALLFLAGRFLLLPAVDRARPGRAKGAPAETRRFRQLHGLSVVINMVQLLTLLVVSVRLAG